MVSRLFPRLACGLLAALGLAIAVGTPTLADAASFRISPARYEFDLKGRYTDSFTITNTTDQRLRLRIYANFVAYDEDNSPQEVGQHPFSMVPWLVIYPRRVSLEPLQKRVVRFTVRAPEELAPGEYRAVVFFEELPGPPQERGTNSITTGFRVDLLTRIGVTMYGMVGDANVDLSLHDQRTSQAEQQLRWQGRITNSGNTHVQVALECLLVAENGTTVSRETVRAVVHRDGHAPVNVDFKLPPPGKYIIQSRATWRDGVLFEAEHPVTVTGSGG
jgi:hypothetical protein